MATRTVIRWERHDRPNHGIGATLQGFGPDDRHIATIKPDPFFGGYSWHVWDVLGRNVVGRPSHQGKAPTESEAIEASENAFREIHPS